MKQLAEVLLSVFGIYVIARLVFFAWFKTKQDFTKEK